MSIQELEDYFATVKLPEKPVKINGFATIEESDVFVAAQMAIITREPQTYQKTSAYLRIMEFKQWLENNSYA
ncbi:DUF6965 family protein [Dyadobacter sp. CY356]|uniref:DUF6965 family protein n=1 Tax=Dyadobacter sp. CY356 TaxID=2906442 RepID=UPI001F2E093F|nr:hypothetical protein [Dyadobacter sp. CY356]MCF0055014.1 hypothetical protein [Dyadobacter sp. CY356]